MSTQAPGDEDVCLHIRFFHSLTFPTDFNNYELTFS